MTGMLAFRIVTLALLVTGAVQSVRRGDFTAKDRRALAVILAVCALLAGAVVVYVIYFLPAPIPPSRS